MQYVSTLGKTPSVFFRDAVTRGMASDGGLFVPVGIPEYSVEAAEAIMHLDLKTAAATILSPFIAPSLSHEQVIEVIEDTLSFSFPLIKIGNSGFQILELFHGPTEAFKDVGARFLSRLLHTWSDWDHPATILVATSGDTGGAVADACRGMENVRLIILYPDNRVSPHQEWQMTSIGDNVEAYAVDGNFDDCQRMVKAAFSNITFSEQYNLTSANSINIGRWLPQMIYYLSALQSFGENRRMATFYVPSGNFGNITAGLLLQKMGFPIRQLIATHNANETMPLYFSSGIYNPGETIHTLAHAMDVSDPGNFVRYQYLEKHFHRDALQPMRAKSITDPKILQTIRDVYERFGYILDPHTATGWAVAQEMNLPGIILATAHPRKCLDVVERALGSLSVLEKWKLEPGSIERNKIPPTASALMSILAQ